MPAAVRGRILALTRTSPPAETGENDNPIWIWPTFRDRLGPGVSHGQVIALS
jgi:hypothetical protein